MLRWEQVLIQRRKNPMYAYWAAWIGGIINLLSHFSSKIFNLWRLLLVNMNIQECVSHLFKLASSSLCLADTFRVRLEEEIVFGHLNTHCQSHREPWMFAIRLARWALENHLESLVLRATVSCAITLNLTVVAEMQLIKSHETALRFWNEIKLSRKRHLRVDLMAYLFAVIIMCSSLPLSSHHPRAKELVVAVRNNKSRYGIEKHGVL